jgi:hypothetical protein
MFANNLAQKNFREGSSNLNFFSGRSLPSLLWPGLPVSLTAMLTGEGRKVPTFPPLACVTCEFDRNVDRCRQAGLDFHLSLEVHDGPDGDVGAALTDPARQAQVYSSVYAQLKKSTKSSPQTTFVSLLPSFL